GCRAPGCFVAADGRAVAGDDPGAQGTRPVEPNANARRAVSETQPCAAPPCAGPSYAPAGVVRSAPRKVPRPSPSTGPRVTLRESANGSPSSPESHNGPR